MGICNGSKLIRNMNYNLYMGYELWTIISIWMWNFTEYCGSSVLNLCKVYESSCWALIPQVCPDLPRNREKPGACIWQPHP